ncbi:MAG: MoaD/ThiS family protein [Candidatus Thorarchaeota archaeon]|nr:MoaD/ThiS family protein [Candidatus Thorarchaeota archaeon]
MRVSVKLYATLRRFAPLGTAIGDAFDVQLEGSTVSDLIQQLKIKIESAKIIMINGIRILDLHTRLNEDDLVVIFPPVGGG